MTAETARLAIEALARLVGKSDNLEIEVVEKGEKDND